MPNALWLQPLASYKPCVVVHPWNPSIQEEEAEGPEVPGPLQQHSKFETSLSYMSLSQKKNQNGGPTQAPPNGRGREYLLF